MMDPLALNDYHKQQQAHFCTLNGSQTVAHYGEPIAELRALHQSAAFIDLSFRGRLCLTGADRLRFLNGQVTNNLKSLSPGQGCYACLLNARGKLQSDLNIYHLDEEFLLDFEPGLTHRIQPRLEQYIIADDVQVVNVAPLFGHLSLWGPLAQQAFENARLGLSAPQQPWTFSHAQQEPFGDLYCMLQPFGNASALHFYLPNPALETVAQRLCQAVRSVGGRAAGWDALQTFRIESGVPRFGVDMDETNLPPEAGLETLAISYAKGCYIGQEIISRLRTYGQVAKALRGLRLAEETDPLPQKGDALFANRQEVGYITSATYSPTLDAKIALGYVRREHWQLGTRLSLPPAQGNLPVTIVPLPFSP